MNGTLRLSERLTCATSANGDEYFFNGAESGAALELGLPGVHRRLLSRFRQCAREQQGGNRDDYRALGMIFADRRASTAEVASALSELINANLIEIDSADQQAFVAELIKLGKTLARKAD